MYERTPQHLFESLYLYVVSLLGCSLPLECLMAQTYSNATEQYITQFAASPKIPS